MKLKKISTHTLGRFNNERYWLEEDAAAAVPPVLVTGTDVSTRDSAPAGCALDLGPFEVLLTLVVPFGSCCLVDLLRAPKLVVSVQFAADAAVASVSQSFVVCHTPSPPDASAFVWNGGGPEGSSRDRRRLSAASPFTWPKRKTQEILSFGSHSRKNAKIFLWTSQVLSRTLAVSNAVDSPLRIPFHIEGTPMETDADVAGFTPPLTLHVSVQFKGLLHVFHCASTSKKKIRHNYLRFVNNQVLITVMIIYTRSFLIKTFDNAILHYVNFKYQSHL